MPTSYPSQCSWMSGLDDRLLSQHTIPGTHQSGALFGGDSPQCQKRPLSQQLQIGVRVLDVRLCQVGNNFSIHHAGQYQRAYFDKDTDYSPNPDCKSFVLQDCLNFLADNQTECIVMCIKQENSSMSGAQFNAQFLHIIQQNQRDSMFYLQAAFPRLDSQIRGRIVLVNREEKGLGIYWGDWDKALTPSTDPLHRNLDVEDHHKEIDLGHKWTYVNDHLKKAFGVAASDTTWFLTYSSASSSLLPWMFADYINPRIISYLGSSVVKTGTRFGSMFVDFATPALSACIIQQAWKSSAPHTPPLVLTQTTPWLFDEYDGSIKVDHDYGQNNRVMITPKLCAFLEILYSSGYGIINLRVRDQQYNPLAPEWPFSNNQWGSDWLASDFDGQLFSAPDPNGPRGVIDGVQFGYQGGKGLVNVRVHLHGKAPDQWENWLTPVKPGDFDFTTDAYVSTDGIRWLGTWRQDGRGLVDGQSCYYR